MSLLLLYYCYCTVQTLVLLFDEIKSNRIKFGEKSPYIIVLLHSVFLFPCLFVVYNQMNRTGVYRRTVDTQLAAL